MKTKNKFFKCECGSHAIDVTTFDDEPEVYICMWDQGSKDDHRLSLWERFRWSWKILLTGKPYQDNVILSKNKAKELGEYLKELTCEH